ncbi:hypothetical protein BCR37DRAFT_412805 [Protomyces lactucae-debilis]|uniref:Uncharacterized protein n=1 Tax=Protomyces lactucae-debilis TaxID=2754530 RepID=A0A1Y2FLA7_PROLT|nr:uncharacterized protein BCR37DRAFT_412805 [Protomyces lactucae-debilis]ORY84367.1 hypothetical protein BCR37DRAFT_412805 [Protomyces lactucae-debilis]
MGFKHPFMLASLSTLLVSTTAAQARTAATGEAYQVVVYDPARFTCFDGGMKPRIYKVEELVNLQNRVSDKELGPLQHLNVYLLEDKDAGMDGDVSVAFKAEGYKKEWRARPVCNTATDNTNVHTFMKDHKLYSKGGCRLHLFIPAVAKTKPQIDLFSCYE